MPISINGSGTISGISVGGLENGCVNADDLATAAVTETKLASNAVTIDKLGTILQSQVCKAWVNFNGTGAVAIRASYNVSSITDNGTGDYTVNFTTALPDANYSATSMGALDESGSGALISNVSISRTAGQFAGSLRVQTYFWASSSNQLADFLKVSVAIFR